MSITIRRLNRQTACLLVVDIQERLLPAMHESERVLANAIRLTRGAAALGIPTFITEQYRKGLGGTVPELAAAVPGVPPREKMRFSACGANSLVTDIRQTSASQVILCGIESHVCVLQTGLDLLEMGLTPFVVADCVSSRTPENSRLGLERLRFAGAEIVSTEMALFELLGEAGTDQFKQILSLVK